MKRILMEMSSNDNIGSKVRSSEGGVPVVKLQCALAVATDCIAMSVAIARGCKVVMCPIG